MAEQLVCDYRSAQLTPPDRALCDFAARLTLVPGQMTEHDIHTLREHGFSDVQITIATQVVGYFNYINRIADGLGVDPEDWMTRSREEWLAEKGRDYLAGLDP